MLQRTDVADVTTAQLTRCVTQAGRMRVTTAQLTGCCASAASTAPEAGRTGEVGATVAGSGARPSEARPDGSAPRLAG